MTVRRRAIRGDRVRAKIREAIPRCLDGHGRIKVEALGEAVGLSRSGVQYQLRVMEGVPRNRTPTDVTRDRYRDSQAATLAALADPANCDSEGRPIGRKVAAALGIRRDSLRHRVLHLPQPACPVRWAPAERGPKPAPKPSPLKGLPVAKSPDPTPEEIAAQAAAIRAEGLAATRDQPGRPTREARDLQPRRHRDARPALLSAR